MRKFFLQQRNKILTVNIKKINLKCKRELFNEYIIWFDKTDEMEAQIIKIIAIDINLFSNILFSPRKKKNNIDNITIDKSAVNLLNIKDIGNDKTK